MLKHVDHKKMGRSRLGWLDSYFHFSFAEYYNPQNMHFGVLRVFNDDIVQPKTGFDAHPHQDMEILTYVLEGELSHKDSMGNARTLTRGQVQYMSAGTGVVHSELNRHALEELRLMQIWILPDKKRVEPNYGDYLFALEERFEKWLPIATGYDNAGNGAPIKMHQDVNFYATILSAGKSIALKTGKGRQCYMVCMEGEANIGEIHLDTRDALEIAAEDITITAKGECHLLAIEMACDGSIND